MATVSAVAKAHQTGYGASAAAARGSVRAVRRTGSALLMVSTADSAAAGHGRCALKNSQFQPPFRTRFSASARR
jgi:hypothetical protein